MPGLKGWQQFGRVPAPQSLLPAACLCSCQPHAHRCRLLALPAVARRGLCRLTASLPATWQPLHPCDSPAVTCRKSVDGLPKIHFPTEPPSLSSFLEWDVVSFSPWRQWAYFMERDSLAAAGTLSEMLAKHICFSHIYHNFLALNQVTGQKQLNLKSGIQIWRKEMNFK